MFLTRGTFHDASAETFHFRNLLDSKGFDYRHVVVNEGRSWGNWRALLDDILLHYWAVE